MPKLTVLIWNNIIQYENEINFIVDSFKKIKDIQLIYISKFAENYKNYTYEDLYQEILRLNVNIIARREEHSCLYSIWDPEWMKLVKRCEEKNIKYATFDYGYFNHYKTYMADFSDKYNKSSIHKDWTNLSETVNWNNTLSIVQEHRSNFLKKYEIACNLKPIANLPEKNYVTIWPQQDAVFLRPEFQPQNYTENGITDWIIKICSEVKNIGMVPVVKLTVPMATRRQIKIEEIKKHCLILCDTTEPITGIKSYDNINASLIAHSAFNIVGSSSVTNELVLTERPVIATGKSWFNNLEIFSEPTNWNELFKEGTRVNKNNRNKWINWWFNRQCLKSNLPEKILEVYGNLYL